jgi:hypothetical protein
VNFYKDEIVDMNVLRLFLVMAEHKIAGSPTFMYLGALLYGLRLAARSHTAAALALREAGIQPLIFTLECLSSFILNGPNT